MGFLELQVKDNKEVRSNDFFNPWRLIMQAMSYIDVFALLSLIHRYPDIFECAPFFIFGYGFRPHISDETGIRIRNVLNPLSRMEIFE